MRKIKNIVCAGDYAYVEGGAAKMTIQTAILLSENTDYHVYFIGGCGEACPELRESKVSCMLLGLPDLLQNSSKADAFIHGIYNKTVYRKVTELFRTLDPAETVLHVQAWTKVLTSAVFKAAQDCGIKIVLSVHDYFLACPNGGCYNYVSREICTLKPMGLQCRVCNCDSRSYVYKIWRVLRQMKQNRVLRGIPMHYIFTSAYQREQLHARGVPLVHHRGQFPVVPESYIRNVINVGERHRVPAEENEIFLLVARMVPEKGVELFCEAVTRAGVKAVAVGDGFLKKELEQKYPNITFIGWQTTEEIRQWTEKTRCFVFSSVWFEASPLIVPEMQSFGIPCIVTDCSAATDTMRDGENGFVVPADASAMAEAIRKFADDSTVKELSIATYEGFNAEECSAETYIQNLTKVYEGETV